MERRDAAWLVLMSALFLAFHLPGLFRDAPGMDEDLYAVPGITILRTGLPQIPYIPARDARTFYDRADVALYTLPPLGFYLQVPTLLLLGDGIGPARLASTLTGLAAVWLVHGLALSWVGSRRAALLAAFAWLFSRTFLFPALTARPDMMAAAFGLLAVWFVSRYPGDPSRARPIASGIAAGLSMLSHPFGIVAVVQVGLRLLILGGSPRERLVRLLRYGLAALGALGLWGLLIALHPDIFWHQFSGNVLGRAGSGLTRTLLNPWPALAFQFGQVVERAMPIPTIFAGLGALWVAWRSRSPGPLRELAFHLGSSAVLLVLFMGKHPLLGYFVYPAAFAAIAIGGAWDACATRLAGSRLWHALGTAGAVAVLTLGLLPGSGIRAVLAQYQHLRDPSYDHRQVARTLMAELPPDTLVAVDGPFVLEFYLAGRPVIDALYLEFLPLPYEYVILGREGFRRARIEPDDLILVSRHGDPDDLFAPYAEIWKRKPGAAVWHDPPAP